MKRLLAIVACAIALPAAAENTAGLIVKFRQDTAKASIAPSTRLARLADDAGVALRHVRTLATGAQLVALERAVPLALAQATAARLAANVDVEYAEPDRRVYPARVANDEFFNGQGYLNDGPTGISAYSAWDITTGSPNVAVAVVDTGVRPHADLAGRLLPGYDMVSGIQAANDGDGRDPDPSDPGDWVVAGEVVDGDSDCNAANSSWHGTAVSGIIAADTNNALWTAGIDWSAKILPVRALGKCGGSVSDVTDGIAWAAGLSVPGVPSNPTPAQVINLSLGGDHPCTQSYTDAINAAYAHGVTRAIVAAAGNSSADVSTSAPANCPGVIAVASTTTGGDLAQYSNFGAGITISAPGGQYGAHSGNQGIIVLSNYGTTTPAADGFLIGGGTSFAAPMVSGTVALMLAVAPSLTATQVRNILVSTAKPFLSISDCTTAICGAGIVDAAAAVRSALLTAPAALNYEGLWWDSAESGWGINLVHQSDQIYLTWYTYDAAGKASWLAMLAAKSAPGTYSGDIIEVHGPPFNASPFAPAPTSAIVGSGTLTFADANNGTFSYTAKGVPGTKPITRFPFTAPPPVCTYGSAPDFASATNYQDLWWNSSESGWGINIVHQGTQIFATWYTYDADGSPLWFNALMDQASPGTFRGALLRTSGPPFGAPWNASQIAFTTVGTATLAFSSGNAATWSYSVGSIVGSKTMTRFLFAAPAGTLCR